MSGIYAHREVEWGKAERVNMKLHLSSIDGLAWQVDSGCGLVGGGIEGWVGG